MKMYKWNQKKLDFVYNVIYNFLYVVWFDGMSSNSKEKIMGKRMNIALCVGMIENAFTNSIIDGAMLGAKDIDANLFILPVGIIDAQYDNVGANCYRYQYNTLTSVIHAKSFDAVVLEYGTVTSFLDEEQKSEFLRQFDGIPIMLVAGEREGYSSVCVDNKTGLEEVISYLIEEKSCTRIGFVSGPPTSQDANERLEVFRDTVRKYNLDLSDDYVVYGNFSEFSEGVVEQLLDAHPDIQAIVCANDQMASGCYNVLKEHNKKPGVDVYVTGFDNSATAMMLMPPLTSVRAETKELGYMAVKKCLDLVRKEQCKNLVPTRMVARQSTGSSSDISIDLSNEKGIVYDARYIKNLADITFLKFFNNYYESNETNHMKGIVENFFDYYLHLVDDEGKLCFDRKRFLDEYEKFSQTYRNGYIELDDFISVIYMLYHHINYKIESETERLILVEVITAMNQEMISNVTKKRLIDAEKTKLFEVSLTNITRDMLQNADSESAKYETVISKLQYMGFESSYIFSYGSGITHTGEDTWNPVDYVYVKGYRNQDKQEFFTGKEKRLSIANLFRSSLMPDDRPVSMLVMPIFSGTEQFGLILTESELDYFRYASQIVCQVGVSVEVMEIIKKQNAIKKELEKELSKMAENNKMLDAMSHTDALTGICNRRGFQVEASAILKNPSNYGKRAVAIYADMDCLKIVNDEFGHDEGDFSLKTIADTLTESFRGSDVVARMGGDEFAAFSIASYSHFEDKIKKRIQSILMEKNINDKPYYVNMSIGTYEFIIDEHSDIDEILGYADRALYEEKKNKVKVVYKNK